MAMTNTYVTGAVSATAQFLTLNAYTAPSGRPKPLLRVDDEIMLITDTTNSPTLGVVRGYMGTLAAAHEAQTAVTYGNSIDFQTSKGPTQTAATLNQPAIYGNTLEVTATGATGTTAALITVPPPAFINVTGAANSGCNLPVPSPGESFTFLNKTTGTIKLYCVGGTINGTTGTTAFSLTATGNLMAFANCATAGAWQIGGNT